MPMFAKPKLLGALAVALALTMLCGPAGCGNSAPTILDVIVKSEGLGRDQAPTDLEMTLTLDDGSSDAHRFALGPKSLPGVISAELPGGTSGSVQIRVVALLDQTPVAAGHGQANLEAGRHNSTTITVTPAGLDGGTDGPPSDAPDAGRDLGRDVPGDFAGDRADGSLPDRTGDAPADGGVDLPSGPVISAVCPRFLRAGDPFEVDGAGFQSGASLLVGRQPVPLTQPATGSLVLAALPADLSGALAVRVTNPDGSFAEKADALTVAALANLRVVSFTRRGGHYVYTIAGDGISASLQGLIEVHFDGSAVTVSNVSDGLVRGQAPSRSSGSVSTVEVCYAPDRCSAVTTAQICASAGMVTY